MRVRFSPRVLLVASVAGILLGSFVVWADEQRAKHGGATAPAGATFEIRGFVRVIDGDTLDTWVNGKRVGIGVLGAEAPQGNTDCGRAATGLLWKLVEGGIRLDDDPDAKLAIDAKKRRMFNVWTLDGRLVAEELVRAGVAEAKGGGQHHQRLKAAETEARAAGRGCLWSALPTSLATRARQAIDAGTAALASAIAGLGGSPALAASTSAAVVPGGFADEPVVGGITDPTAFTFLPDGRILIATQTGVVRIVKDGALLPTPFINLNNRVNSYWDHGLLGIAADPSFATNGHVYLLYTYENSAVDFDGEKTARLTRVTASGDTASPTTEVVILGTQVGSTCQSFPVGADCLPSESPSHSIGNIKFASDGTMFVTVGDAASFNIVDDLALRAQNLDSLAGKVLHVTTTGAGVPSNPFWNGNPNANRSKIWAYGVRNSYRLNLRPGSNVPYMGDVGWGSWEEVNVAHAGANMGWPCYEGSQRQEGYEPKAVCQTVYGQGLEAIQFGLVEWDHPNNASAAATGGTFYTGTAYPVEYQGAYFYGDYSQSWIKYLRVDASDELVPGSVSTFATNAGGPVDIEMGPDQNLYYIAINQGQLRRVRFVGGTNRLPNAVATATPSSGLSPLAVQFSAAGSTDPDGDPLQFSWSFGDGSPTSTQSNPLKTYTANGAYNAVLTVSDGRGGQVTDTVTITVGNRAPTVTISSPSPSLRYRVGDVITYSGSASDAEDGPLAPATLQWSIDIQHCPGGVCHNHGFIDATGSGSSFTIPDHGDESYFTLRLSATDSAGLTGSATVTLLPQTARLTLDTTPTGMQLVYDGIGGTTPLIKTTIVGSTHTIHAPSPQGASRFISWSDSGAQQHEVTVTADRTITALFSLQTVTFDDRSGEDQPLSGQYPSGVINWGTGNWYHSGPYGSFTTKSASFESGIFSTTFTFVTPRVLFSVRAYNGGPGSSTVTLSCSGQITKTQSVAVGQVATIASGWTGPCGTVTIGSSNGFNTNFDDLVYEIGAPAPPDTSPPQISAVQATAVTANGATITWTTNEAADTQVEYGTTTSYGASTTLDPSLVAAHSQSLAGLTASTLYHYRVRSRDAAGNLAISNDFAFTTTAPPPPDTTPPQISAVQASAIGSANATITWSTDEPADTQVEYGTTTAYGSATTLNTSLVTAHSQSLSGLAAGTLYHYRVRSRDAAGNLATSPDFTFTTASSDPPQVITFNDRAGQDQPLSGQYPTGVVNWGTAGWYHSGPWGLLTTKSASFSSSGMTSASFTFVTPRLLVSLRAYNGGSGPTTVTLSCSGQTTKTQTVPAGVVATITTGWTGTCGVVTVGSSNGWNTNYDDITHQSGATTPDTTPPQISAVQASAIGATGATITWTTDEAADTQVEYGTTTAYGSTTTLNTALVTSHSQSLSGLTASTLYHYRTKSRDAAGNLATSNDFTFTTTSSDPAQTVTFDDRTGQDQPLNGQYPTGVINWGTGGWYHSGPWGLFTTKSVSFNSSGLTSASFTFVNPRVLVSVRAYNGGSGTTTVTLSCAGQPTKTQTVPAGQTATIATGWTTPCGVVTIGSSNGWNTNFDDITHGT